MNIVSEFYFWWKISILLCRWVQCTVYNIHCTVQDIISHCIVYICNIEFIKWGGGVGLQRWVSKITETWVKLEVHRETHHVPKIHGISEYKPTRSYASVYVRLFLTYSTYNIWLRNQAYSATTVTCAVFMWRFRLFLRQWRVMSMEDLLYRVAQGGELY